MKNLTNKRRKSYQNLKIYCIYQGKLKINMLKKKNIINLKAIGIVQEKIGVLHIGYVVTHIELNFYI